MDIPGRRTVLFTGGLLGALFLFLAMRTLDWNALSAELAHAYWPDFIPALLAVLVYFVVKASRWRLLIRPLATASTRQLLPSVTAGIAGNYVFPHAGEFARTVLAGKRLRVPVAALLATVVIERVFDFLSLLLLAVVILVLAGRTAPEIRVACWTAGVLGAALLSVAIALLYYQKSALRMIERFLVRASSHLCARVLRQLRAAHAGFGAIAKPQLLIPILLLSLLQWSLILASVKLCLHSVGAAVTLAASVSVLLLNVIGLTLPAAPGHVGTVQLAFMVGLAPFGVSQPDAIAASLFYNFLTVVPALILGFSGLRRAGMILHRHLAS